MNYKIIAWKATHRISGPTIDEQINTIYTPLVDRLIADRTASGKETLFVGVSAPQGSGKSTLASLMKLLLEEKDFSVTVVSIDDLYLPLKDREELLKISPLFAYRGPPGTHDTQLGLEIFEKLERGEPVNLPKFDKAGANGKGERCLESEWERVETRPHFVLFEGWFVGAKPLTEEKLAQQTNRSEEKQGAAEWKDYWNTQLAGDYAKLFAKLDKTVVITPPNMETVFANREEQEVKLRAHLAEMSDQERAGKSAMTTEQVRTFVEHFESITRHMLENPKENLTRMDYQLVVNPQRVVTQLLFT